MVKTALPSDQDHAELQDASKTHISQAVLGLQGKWDLPHPFRHARYSTCPVMPPILIAWLNTCNTCLVLARQHDGFCKEDHVLPVAVKAPNLNPAVCRQVLSMQKQHRQTAVFTYIDVTACQSWLAAEFWGCPLEPSCVTCTKTILSIIAVK